MSLSSLEYISFTIDQLLCTRIHNFRHLYFETTNFKRFLLQSVSNGCHPQTNEKLLLKKPRTAVFSAFLALLNSQNCLFAVEKYMLFVWDAHEVQDTSKHQTLTSRRMQTILVLPDFPLTFLQHVKQPHRELSYSHMENFRKVRKSQQQLPNMNERLRGTLV